MGEPTRRDATSHATRGRFAKPGAGRLISGGLGLRVGLRVAGGLGESPTQAASRHLFRLSLHNSFSLASRHER